MPLRRYFLKKHRHMTVLQSIAIKVSERHSLVFCNFLQYRSIRHEILFHASYNDTVITCRKQVTGAPVRDIWFRYLYTKYRHVPILLEKVLAKSIAIQKYPAMNEPTETINE